MSRPIRFYADEHISMAVCACLRRRGIDVLTTAEAGLTSATDLPQLRHAHEAGRVLITQDTDFLRLHSEGEEYSGIAFFRQGERPGRMLRMLALLFDVVTAEEIAGRVEFL